MHSGTSSPPGSGDSGRAGQRGGYRPAVGMGQTVSETSTCRITQTDFSASRAEQEDLRLRHDLRQSIGAVNALVAALAQTPTQRAAALERLRQVQREVEWMRALLQGEEPGGEAPASPVADVCEAAYAAWAAVGATTSCRLALTLASRCHVRAEPALLRRAARNLIENAVRAAGAGGHVRVDILRTTVEVGIRVTDDGPGFGRVPSQSGLGLVGVSTLARRAKGRLVIDGSPAGGPRSSSGCRARHGCRRDRGDEDRSL